MWIDSVHNLEKFLLNDPVSPSITVCNFFYFIEQWNTKYTLSSIFLLICFKNKFSIIFFILFISFFSF